jgi:hydroxymethylpyrimidine pyrophosphatase-like HAD family hydrolase
MAPSPAKVGLVAPSATSARLVATDLDGTLLRPDGTVSKRTAEAVQAAQEAGIYVIPVTGRPPRATWDIALSAQLGPLGVCANGAAVVDLGTLEVVELQTIEAGVATGLVERLRRRFPGVVFAVEQPQRLAYERGFFGTERLWEDVVFEVDDILAALSQAAVKLIVRRPGCAATDMLVHLAGADATVATGAVGHLLLAAGDSTAALLADGDSAGTPSALTGPGPTRRALGSLSVTSSGLDWVEIAAKGISKAYGTWRVCQRLGVDRADVLAVGDYYNDLPLLGWAGQAAAPANALPEVLAAAQFVLPSNAEDGVAQLLEELASCASR